MDIGGDVRYALRSFRKSPGVLAVAILSLALGIGANTAIFTIVDAVLLKWLPVQAPEQLYMVAAGTRDRPSVSWNYPDYVAFRDRNHGFAGLIAYGSASPMGFQVQGEPQTTLARGLLVSGNYFQTLGVEPALGRVLNPEDDRAPGAGPQAVLSYSFWQQRFGADPRVIGKSVRVNSFPFTIVGVARAGFSGVEVGTAPDFFIPVLMHSEVTGAPFNRWNTRHWWWLRVMGRLSPGAAVGPLEAELSVISKQQEEDERRTARDPRSVNEGRKIVLLPGSQGYSFVRNRLQRPLVVLMIVVALVLVIACANVANLLLARAAARQREIAVRLAIGASRRRLVGQLLTESVLLAALGGLAGLLFSFLGVRLLLGLMPQSGMWDQVSLKISPDLRMLGFTLGVSLVTGLIFGLAPALQATKPDLVPALKDETGGMAAGRVRFGLRRGLVVAQVALSLLLLIGAGLFVRSLQNLRDLDAGFRRDHLLLIDIDPSRSGYKGQRLRDFYEGLRERVENLPGVRVASLANITPLSGSRWNQDVTIEGYQWKPGERRYIDMNAVGPRFFEAAGIPILLGRDFRAPDSPSYSPDPPAAPSPGPRPEDLVGPKVVIVNQTMANHFFPGQSPIGKRLCFGEEFWLERFYEIVGVVKDVRYFGLREPLESMIYQPVWRPGAGRRTLCLRTAGDPQQLTEAVRREAQAIDNTIPVLSARTMEQQVDNNVLQERLVATLSSFFGVLALLLAAVGLYGVMAHAVTRRTREIGIRMALGAPRPAVLWLVLRDAGLLVLIGAALGVPIALAVTRFVASFLYGIGARDPWNAALATAVLLAVAAVASYVPARRATNVDPLAALRYE